LPIFIANLYCQSTIANPLLPTQDIDRPKIITDVALPFIKVALDGHSNKL
jgi:hypothetical protein